MTSHRGYYLSRLPLVGPPQRLHIQSQHRYWGGMRFSMGSHRPHLALAAAEATAGLRTGRQGPVVLAIPGEDPPAAAAGTGVLGVRSEERRVWSRRRSAVPVPHTVSGLSTRRHLLRTARLLRHSQLPARGEAICTRSGRLPERSGLHVRSSLDWPQGLQALPEHFQHEPVGVSPIAPIGTDRAGRRH